jgi:hypothetical protein
VLCGLAYAIFTHSGLPGLQQRFSEVRSQEAYAYWVADFEQGQA